MAASLELEMKAVSTRIAGERVQGARRLEIRNPYTGQIVGSVPKATLADVKRAFEVAAKFKPAR